ncbi:MAG TPA: hypothetical protein VLV83_25770 [Acidobacteriota bacterium]|nr:hypothetical protein [Acidobacteriota bacterium]
MRKGFTTLLLTISLLWLPPPLRAQQPPEAPREAAFLFAYLPKEGMEALFRQGYRRHLEWHREKNDPLVWYGWTVVTGERIGQFIDGTFGLAFADFDRRVEPAADRADFAQTTAPFANPVYRRAYRLRTQLSTASPLEEREPPPMIAAIHVRVRPGKEEVFEEALRRLRARLQESSDPSPYTWYQLINGGEHPSYLWMIPVFGFASLETSPVTLADLVSHALPPDRAAALQASLAQAVHGSVSEIWLYQPDLTYLRE